MHKIFQLIRVIAIVAFATACSSAEYTIAHPETGATVDEAGTVISPGHPGIKITGRSHSNGEAAASTAANAYATMQAADANRTVAEAEAAAIRKRAEAQALLAYGYGEALKNGTVAPYGYGAGWAGGDRAFYFQNVRGVAPAAGQRNDNDDETTRIAREADKRSSENRETLERLHQKLRAE